MSVLDDIEYRRGIDAGIRQTIERLTRNAQDPDKIGRRVLAWRFHLRRDESLSKFSDRLKRSVPTASVAVSEAQSAILEIRISNTNSAQ